MQINGINNNNDYSTNFNGRIPKTKLIRKHIDMAIDMAASYKTEEDKTLSKQFFNTLRAMKNDGTDKVLSIRYKYPKIAKNIGDHQYDFDYIVRYGRMKETVHYWSVIDTVVKFGEKLFGKNAKNFNLKELDAAEKAQEWADMIYENNQKTIKLLNAESDIAQKKANAEYKKAFGQLLDKQKK